MLDSNQSDPVVIRAVGTTGAERNWTRMYHQVQKFCISILSLGSLLPPTSVLSCLWFWDWVVWARSSTLHPAYANGELWMNHLGWAGVLLSTDVDRILPCNCS